MNDEERAELSLRIERARTARGLSKEAAAKAAGVTPTTWRRAESGLRVHDHKLSAMLEVVGLGPVDPGAEETYPDVMWSDKVFVMPPEIEVGYTDVVRFTKAVQDAAPPLTLRATRLMLDAAGLFAEAGDYLLEKGGDGHADDTRGAAPMSEPEAAHDEQHTIEEEQGHDETP